MIYPPELLDALQGLSGSAWTGTVFRHMFAHYPPSLINIRGARWNPAGVGAIYTSLEREIALAEAEYHIAAQPIRPSAPRTLYTINVSLSNVLELDTEELLAVVGLTLVEVAADDLEPCQRVGGAAAWLGHDGILVPSARATGANLVIFPQSQDADDDFEVVASEAIV